MCIGICVAEDLSADAAPEAWRGQISTELGLRVAVREPNPSFVIVEFSFLTTDPSLQSQTNRFGLHCFPPVSSSPFLQLTFFFVVLIQCAVLSLTHKYNTSLVLDFLLLEKESFELSNAYSYPDNFCMLYFLFICSSLPIYLLYSMLFGCFCCLTFTVWECVRL